MKKLIFLCLFSINSLVFLSCVKNENAQRIIGNWKGVSWLVNGQPSDYNIESTHFSFDDKGHYSFDYDGSKVSGSYKVEHDMLFTTLEDQREIMVKIVQLVADTLVFDMNRGGQAEMLTLVRTK